jgi:hypothetical protein
MNTSEPIPLSELRYRARLAQLVRLEARAERRWRHTCRALALAQVERELRFAQMALHAPGSAPVTAPIPAPGNPFATRLRSIATRFLARWHHLGLAPHGLLRLLFSHRDCLRGGCPFPDAGRGAGPFTLGAGQHGQPTALSNGQSARAWSAPQLHTP